MAHVKLLAEIESVTVPLELRTDSLSDVIDPLPTVAKLGLTMLMEALTPPVNSYSAPIWVLTFVPTVR